MNSKKKTSWILGGVVIALAVVGLSVVNLGQNLVYFYTPEEAFAQSRDLESKVIRVGGMVQAGSVQWNSRALELDFVLTDFKGHNFNVHHKGTPPDLFKEGQGVVVEGWLEGEQQGEELLSMKSKKLLVKHSEEYKKPDGTHGSDKELLQKSLFKD